VLAPLVFFGKEVFDHLFHPKIKICCANSSESEEDNPRTRLKRWQLLKKVVGVKRPDISGP
jgi:hypothetical protein